VKGDSKLIVRWTQSPGLRSFDHINFASESITEAEENAGKGMPLTLASVKVNKLWPKRIYMVGPLASTAMTFQCLHKDQSEGDVKGVKGRGEFEVVWEVGVAGCVPFCLY